MIVKVMKRCTGKTTELIKISHKTGYRIITSSFSRAKNIEFAAKRMKLDIPDPVSFAIYMLPNRKECIRRKEDQRVLIDDLDSVITAMFHSSGIIPVAATTGLDSMTILMQQDLYKEFEAEGDGYVVRAGLTPNVKEKTNE